MSEYWVSKKKYWCQYCEIYIADDVPSRSQHENGLRHKGNKDRFIRSLYKAGVKKKHESEEEKREMKRVEQAAQAAYARDVGAGVASASSSSSSASGLSVPAPKPRNPPPKPSDPYTNYTTAASLGISDPDVDRLIEEAKVRKSEGRAGDWVAVPPPPPPPPLVTDGDTPVSSAAEGVKLEQDGSSSVGEVRKRVEEEPVDEDDARRFKMRKKTVAVGLGEIYDPGVIRVKPRVQRAVEEETTMTAAAISVVASKQPAASGPVLGGDVPRLNGRSGMPPAGTLPGATEKPSWTPRGWKRAGEDSGDQEGDSNASYLQPRDAAIDQKPKQYIDGSSEASGGEAKKEDAYTGDALVETDEKVKEEPTVPVLLSVDSSTGGLFRKRKVPVGSNRGRRHG